MGVKTSKRVVIVLVEGESEKDALWGPLEALMEEYNYRGNVEVRFGHIKDDNENCYGGDITSKDGVHPGCIVKLINRLMLYWVFKADHIFPRDIIEVIHLVDLDGAYIPDSNIQPELADYEAKNVYINDTIITRDTRRTIQRNENKRNNIDYLVSLSEITVSLQNSRNVVPYSVYYFSSNLDHYLHNNANIKTPREKREKAQRFSDRCVDDLGYLFKTFLDDPAGVGDLGYQESWDYVRQGTNSVNRHSNLGVLIKRIIDGKN